MLGGGICPEECNMLGRKGCGICPGEEYALKIGKARKSGICLEERWVRNMPGMTKGCFRGVGGLVG